MILISNLNFIRIMSRKNFKDILLDILRFTFIFTGREYPENTSRIFRLSLQLIPRQEEYFILKFFH